MLPSGAVQYLLYDGLGSVRQVLNGAGSPLLAQTFDPYGNPYSYAGPTESVTGYGYTGEQTDSNGLMFLRARYYAPSMGRFLNMDPSRLEMNPYLYSYNNPLNYTDPSGLIVTRGDVEDGKHEYSCLCGWVDWDHFLVGLSESLISALNHTTSDHSTTGGYWGIQVEQGWLEAVFGSTFGYSATALIDRHNPLLFSSTGRKDLAMSIFMSFQERYERWQAMGGFISNFSKEDLMSDFLGFYAASKGLSQVQIRELCEGFAIDSAGIQASLMVYDEMTIFQRLKKIRQWASPDLSDLDAWQGSTSGNQKIDDCLADPYRRCPFEIRVMAARYIEPSYGGTWWWADDDPLNEFYSYYLYKVIDDHVRLYKFDECASPPI